MDAVVRAGAIYVALLIIFRLAGKRSLAQITTFDAVLLLIISESTQGALVGDNNSVGTSLIVIVTLVTLDIGLSLLTFRAPLLGKLVNGVPVIVVQHGEPIRERMNKARLSDYDVLEEARRQQGLERMEQVKYAILEKGGGISIIPAERQHG